MLIPCFRGFVQKTPTRYVGNSPVNFIDPSGLRQKNQFTPVDGEQSMFTGGGPQRGGGFPGGSLPSGGNFGGSNLRPSLPTSIPNTTIRNTIKPSIGEFQGPLYMPDHPFNNEKLPANNAPNPNKCDLPTKCPNPLPVFLEIRSRYPRHFELVQTAIRRGKPTILTVADNKLRTINRNNGNNEFGRVYGSADIYGVNSTLLKNRINPPPGRRPRSLSQWDEYPYASTAESGINSVFAAISSRENNDHGQDLRRFYATANKGSRLMPGCKFSVVLIP